VGSQNKHVEALSCAFCLPELFVLLGGFINRNRDWRVVWVRWASLLEFGGGVPET
jgi:hypothetical protein